MIIHVLECTKRPSGGGPPPQFLHVSLLAILPAVRPRYLQRNPIVKVCLAMSSPPPSNILLDPITELETALRNNAFGINSSTSRLIYESSFPVTPEDKQRIASDSPKSGTTAHEVIAKAEIGLLEGDIAEVVLDRRGYTVCFPSLE